MIGYVAIAILLPVACWLITKALVGIAKELIEPTGGWWDES